MDDTLERLTTMMGVILLGVAFVLLMVALTTAYQIFYSPEEVPAVTYIEEFMSSRAPLFSANVAGNVSTFEVDRGVRFIVVAFLGVFIVGALGSVLGVLLKAGQSLLSFVPPVRGTNDN